eukprot:m.188877 g.188877  ORF g.188877 m.188877 type:complete len:78 (-) comp15620_c0_seq11:2717-2950(-)
MYVIYIQCCVKVLISARNMASKNFAWVDGTGYDFDLHMGTNKTRELIEQGASAEDIVKDWQPQLDAWDIKRRTYLLY